MHGRRNLLWIGVAAGLLSLGIARDARGRDDARSPVSWPSRSPRSIRSRSPARASRSSRVARATPITSRRCASRRRRSARRASSFPSRDPAALPDRGRRRDGPQRRRAASSESSGTSAAVMPILGVTKVCLFGAVHPAPLGEPVGADLGGRQRRLGLRHGRRERDREGAPWTTGTVARRDVDARMGFAHGPASGTTSTLNPSGTIRLVTPIFISTNIGASAGGARPSGSSRSTSCPSPGPRCCWARASSRWSRAGVAPR